MSNSNQHKAYGTEEFQSRIILLKFRFLYKYVYIRHYNVEHVCRLGPFRANFEYPGVLPIRLRETSLLGIPV